MHQAGIALDGAGFDRPFWDSLVRGLRPPQPEIVDIDVGVFAHGWQFYASSTLEQQEYTSLLSDLRTVNRHADGRGRPADPARLRPCGGPHAGAWLTAFPTSLMLKLEDDEFACALRRRLGLGITAIDVRCEGCGVDLDAYGHHRSSCGRTGRNHARHRGGNVRLEASFSREW